MGIFQIRAIALAFILLFYVNLVFAQASSDDSSAAKTQAQVDSDSAISAIDNWAQLPINASPTSATQTKMIAALQSCRTKLSAAQVACLDGLSSNISSIGAIMGGVTSALSSALGIADQCSTLSKGLSDVAGLLGAYNTACGVTKAMSSSSCSTAAGVVNSAPALCAKEVPVAANCAASATAAKALPPYASKANSSLNANLTAGMAGLASTLQAMMTTNSCTAATLDTSATALVDCNLAINASNTTCICQLNPRTAGCSGAATASASTPSTSLGTTATGVDGTTLGLPLSDGATAGKAAAAIGGSPGAGGGGSPMSGGLGSGAGTDGKGAAGAAKAGLNTNINSGDYGGGGSFGSGATSKEAAEKYAAYLPKKDARGLASAVAAQVTGSTGMTNWEKVNARYKDNKSTLLNK